jgi:hypothetical protein
MLLSFRYENHFIVNLCACATLTTYYFFSSFAWNSQQSLWRRRKAAKLYTPLLHRMKLAKERKRQNSAISIQSAWRGFIVYSTYLIKRYENKAASTIQATWRGYWQATNYLILYCAVRVAMFVSPCP